MEHEKADANGAASGSSHWVPIGAGIVCAIVAFTATFAVVIGGLEAVGASAAQAASGLLAVSVVMGACGVFLSWRYRMPLTAAWSTPGAALLMSVGAVAGGWPAAIGAFIATGLAIVATGLWPGLAKLVQRIPAPIAQAMLAGILLPLCMAPVGALIDSPIKVAPVLITWLLLTKLRPSWAMPAALIVAFVVIALSLRGEGTALLGAGLLPTIEFTVPTVTLQALTGIALPLYIVTMASQNIPASAVMQGFGYTAPWQPSLIVTGIGSAIAAPFGSHSLNLAALSAAMIAGPEAGPHHRRWIGGVSAGFSYIVLGVMSAGLVTVVLAAPAGVIQAIAGVALIGAFVSSTTAAMSDPGMRLPAGVTLVVAGSGVSAGGMSSAFWALAVGVLMAWLFSLGRGRNRATQ